jgi:hypothetical protein
MDRKELKMEWRIQDNIVEEDYHYDNFDFYSIATDIEKEGWWACVLGDKPEIDYEVSYEDWLNLILQEVNYA